MHIADTFVLAQSRLGESRNGPYWNLTLQDATGSIEAKIWSPLSQNYSQLPPGSFVTVEGKVGSFRDKAQLTIDALRVLNGDAPVNLADFVPASETPPEEMLEAIEDLVTEHMNHQPWKTFCRKVLKSEDIRAKLLVATGAKAVHHAYVGGLLEHTLSVANICMSLCDLYPALDRQVLLAAAIFHDLGKAWELSGGLTNDYTDEGRLVGHIQIGMEKLEPFLRRSRNLDDHLIMHFKHLILSHHGEYEFGSPKVPQTPEAFILHFADNIDAKMNTIFGAFAGLEGEEPGWTGFQRYLDRYLYRPTPTPDSRKAKNNGPEKQCSLPLKV